MDEEGSNISQDSLIAESESSTCVTTSRVCLICNSLLEPKESSSIDKKPSKPDLTAAFSQCMVIPLKDAAIVEELSCLCSACGSSLLEWYDLQSKLVELTLRVNRIQASLAAKVIDLEEQCKLDEEVPLEVVITTDDNDCSTAKRIYEREYTEELKRFHRVRQLICNRFNVSLPVRRLKTEVIEDDSDNDDSRSGGPDLNYSSEEDWAPEAPSPPVTSPPIRSRRNVKLRNHDTALHSDQKACVGSKLKRNNFQSKSIAKATKTLRGGTSRTSRQAAYSVRKSKTSLRDRKGDASDEKLREIAPDKFMLGKFAVIKKDDAYKCITCGVRVGDKDKISRHIRRCHIRRNETTRRFHRCIPVGPDKFVYANKFPICFIDEKYVCGECGVKNPNKYDLLAHVRRSHLLQMNKSKGKIDSFPQPEEDREKASAPFELSEDPADEKSSPEEEAGDVVIEDTEPDLNFNPPELQVKEPYCKEIEPGKYIVGTYTFEKDGDIYKCNTCNRTYPQRNMMTKHVRRAHSEKKAGTRCRYQCESAGPGRFTYAGKYTFELVSTKFLCPECPFKSANKTAMCEHIRVKHIYCIDKFICEECGDEFKDRQSLQHHMKKHKAVTVTPGGHQCAECGKVFARELYLKNHMIIHNEEKKFQCEYCGKKFLRAAHFRSHVPLHTGERPFHCNLCPMTFVTSTTMYYHRKTVHKGERKKTPAQRRREQARGTEQYEDNSAASTSSGDPLFNALLQQGSFGF